MAWRAGLVGLVALLVVASGAVGTTGAATGVVGATADQGGTVTLCDAGTPDPETDVIGWEAGCWHDQSIAIDQSDGLSVEEREAYVARAMARVEFLRDREFNRTVPVEVIPRETHRNRTANQSRPGNYTAWNNQVWEALFIVGGNDDVEAELDTVFGTSVVGFYSPADDEIKIITDTPDRPVLDNATLVHELVHALQDQHFNLSKPQYQGTTQDRQLAAGGLVEGEARYIERQYIDRCGTEWECVASPAQSPGGDGPQPNLGILLTVLNPYSDGPVYIDFLYRQGGWTAIDTAFENPPTSTEQVIHLTDEEPVPIDYVDTSRDDWRRFPDQGVNGSDTAGEASMYVMFWYQARQSGADTIDPSNLFRDLQGQHDTYNYAAVPTAGWGNDRVFPYRKRIDNETRYGYVWVTEWDSRRDAEEFQQAYRRILEAHDATEVGVRTWVIEDGPFADAFRVSRNGTRVTIVNGPELADLAELRPDIDYRPRSTPNATPASTPTVSLDPPSPIPTRPSTTTPGQPGFGTVAGLLGVLIGLWWRRRS